MPARIMNRYGFRIDTMEIDIRRLPYNTFHYRNKVEIFYEKVTMEWVTDGVKLRMKVIS